MESNIQINFLLKIKLQEWKKKTIKTRTPDKMEPIQKKSKEMKSKTKRVASSRAIINKVVTHQTVTSSNFNSSTKNKTKMFPDRQIYKLASNQSSSNKMLRKNRPATSNSSNLLKNER